MAELTESSSSEPNLESVPSAEKASAPIMDTSHLESQLVSMNFVLKNTQSEVIKLQKVLMRYQNRQDDLEKAQSRTEEQLQKAIRNQKDDSAFRSRFLSSLIFTAFISILISFALSQAFAPSTTITSVTETISETQPSLSDSQ